MYAQIHGNTRKYTSTNRKRVLRSSTMDIQGCSKFIREQFLESRKERVRSMKKLAFIICVYVAWTMTFSHTDEMKHLGINASAAVPPIISCIMYIIKNLCSLHIIAGIGWMTSIVFLSIAILPKTIVFLRKVVCTILNRNF